MIPVSFRDLLKHVTPAVPAIAFILGLLLTSSLLALANPWIAGQATALILDESGAMSLTTLLALWALLLVSRAAIDFTTAWRSGIEGELMCAKLRQSFIDHCHALPVSYFNETTVGELLAYFANDIEIAGRFVVTNILPLVPAVVVLCTAVIMMSQLSWLITVTALGLVPFYVLVLRRLTQRIRPSSRAWHDAYSDLLTAVEQRLGNMMLFRIFSNRTNESHIYRAIDNRYVALSREQYFLQAALTPAMSVLAGIGLMLVLLLGAREIDTGNMTAPELVMLVLYANLLRSPLSSLAGFYGQLQLTRGAMDRLQQVFAGQVERQDGARLAITAGEIRLQNLTFRYDAPLLEGVSATIAGGETVALTGANGSGKTTLACLIMGLIRPEPGQILIDGQDIADVAPESLRAAVALVSQHTLLLSDSIANNIAMGETHDIDRVRHAAAAVGADTFIEQLPNGYDTQIGTGGLKLSGGQRQKVALARAVFKDAPILVLDEPTSSFDPVAEGEFADTCRTLLTDRTVLLITHATRLLHLADRILELKDGQLFARRT